MDNSDHIEEIRGKLKDILSIGGENNGLLSETVARQKEIERLLSESIQSQNSISASTSLIAETFKKLEENQKSLQEINENYTDIIAGKSQVPMRTHVYSLCLAAMPGVLVAVIFLLYVLSITNQEVDLTATSLKIKRIVEEQASKIEELKNKLDE